MAEATRLNCRPLIFGIVNMTPDSFSGDGLSSSPQAALTQALEMLEAGADIIDVGAESTRPGSKSVAEDEEWHRLEPILSELAQMRLLSRVSVDTRNTNTMLKAAKLGAKWINCVGAIPDDEDLLQLKDLNPDLGFVVTHIHGTPESMQAQPLGIGKVLLRVEEFFDSSRSQLAGSGFSEGQMLFDPGIGFGKTDEANLLLLSRCGNFARRYPIAVGVSRKSFFGRLLNIDTPKDRDPASKVAEMALAMCNVAMIRTHDVVSLTRCMKLLDGAPP